MPGVEMTWEVGWKVAPPWKPPEATGRENGEASMKTPQQKQQKGLGPVGKAITAGSVCLTFACTGPQVRPEPPAEPCPPGAVQAMAALNIDIGDNEYALFTSGPVAEVISVREGWASLRLFAPFEDLPDGSILKGRLLFGSERVYGRFTEAQEYKKKGVYGRTWPVCLELLDHTGKRGMEMKPGSTADTAKVFNSVEVKAVERFQGG
jgi:serine/threonine-protein kinase